MAMTPGQIAADAYLNEDPDGGAGNPHLIRQAAQIARHGGDDEYAIELEECANGWEGYLRDLGRAVMRGGSDSSK